MFYLTCKVFLSLHVHWITELCEMCIVEVRSLCFTGHVKFFCLYMFTGSRNFVECA